MKYDALSGFAEGLMYNTRCAGACSNEAGHIVVGMDLQEMRIMSVDVLTTCHYGIGLMAGPKYLPFKVVVSL